jgi:hypothetical protein
MDIMNVRTQRTITYKYLDLLQLEDWTSVNYIPAFLSSSFGITMFFTFIYICYPNISNLNLKHLIDSYNEYAKSLSIDQTVDNLLNRKFKSKSQVTNFLISKKDEIFNLRFKQNVNRFDISNNAEYQQLSRVSQWLMNDSIEWSTNYVISNDLPRLNISYLSQLRVNINLIESFIYKNYLIMDVSNNLFLIEATTPCLHAFNAAMGLSL